MSSSSPTLKSSHIPSSRMASNKRKAQRVQRACLNCRKRKQGCEEERPCKRCVEKGVECCEVEPKRKRGRAKGQLLHTHRSRSDCGSGDEMVDYDDDEDNVEDFCESDSEGALSDEDPNSQTNTPCKHNHNSTISGGITTHSFSIGTPHSTSSSVSSSPRTSPSIGIPPRFQTLRHSHSSSSGSSFDHRSSSPSSSSFVEIRDRSSSVSSDVSGIPDSPSFVFNMTDFNRRINLEDPTEVHMDEEDAIQEDEQVNTQSGLNIALLLPFVGNLCSDSSNSPLSMSLDEEYVDHLQIAEAGMNRSLSFSSMDESIDKESDSIYKQCSSSCSDPSSSSALSHIWRSDLPFFTNAARSTNSLCSLPSTHESSSYSYLRDCWNELLWKNQRGELRTLDMDMQRLKDSWKEALRCVRCLEWQKLQSILTELETLPVHGHFGSQREPGLLYWTSGGRIHHANAAFCSLVGYTEEELRSEVALDINSTFYSSVPSYGQKLRPHSIFHPDEAIKILQKQLDSIQCSDRSMYHMNTRLLGKNRQEIPASCSILNLRDSVGVPILTIAIFI